MLSNKPIYWFLTDRGRRFSYAIVTGLGIGSSIIKFAPHTFLLDKYKDFVHNYSNGKPVQLSQELTKRFEECLDILTLNKSIQKLVTPFSIFGYDLFHAGSTSSKFGVAIGIPVNFTYKSLKDLEKDDIKVNQKKIDWSSESGKKLAEALILPEKVQQFALCREILMANNMKVLFESIYPFACVFIIYNASQFLNRKFNLYAAPPLIRGTLYSILATFGLGLYYLMKDMTEVLYETEVDKKLCELGPDFVEAGVIFYTKILQRNQALRELMGPEGEQKYSKMGNENFGIRQPRIALVHRKQYFESELEKLKGNKGEESVV